MQHKDNRIVVPYSKNALYLVQVYEIEQTPDSLVIIPYDKDSDNYGIYKNLKDTSVQYPTIYQSVNTEDDINNLVNKYASHNTPYHIQGLVLNNTTRLERYKIRNPVYEEVRQMRGNQPKIQFRYLTLRQQGKVKDYLQYYPEDGAPFNVFRKQIHNYTHTLYQNYVSCFIKKQNPIDKFPFKYRNHMVQLHKHYIDNLRPDKKYITKGEVISYMNNLPPPQVMFVLNFEMRQRNIDTIIADKPDMEISQSV